MGVSFALPLAESKFANEGNFIYNITTKDKIYKGVSCEVYE